MFWHRRLFLTSKAASLLRFLALTRPLRTKADSRDLIGRSSKDLLMQSVLLTSQCLTPIVGRDLRHFNLISIQTIGKLTA